MDIFNPDFKDFILFLNQYQVQYMLVGGYAVILRGYSRSTGDMDIWVNKTPKNFKLLQNAIREFGLPETKRLLLAFGYVGSYKGFDILNDIQLPKGWALVVKQNKHERGIEQPIDIK